MNNGTTKERKGPVEQSTFKEKQFKICYDGTGIAAGMPAYIDMLMDTELYWGLDTTEHQDMFIRLADKVGPDVLYRWLHQKHELSIAGTKPGIKPKSMPVDCRPPYFDNNDELVGADRFAEYLDHLEKSGDLPDAGRLTASYIDFVSKQAEDKKIKEKKEEKVPEPPPKPGPKPIEGPRPPPLGPHGPIPPATVYGFKVDISVPKNIRPMDVELPGKPGYRMKIWPIDDYERIIEDLDDNRSRTAEQTGVADAVLQGVPTNLEIKAIASYLQHIIEIEEENKPVPIKQKKSKKTKKAAAPEVEESEEMKNIRYAAKVLGNYINNQNVHFTPEDLQRFAEAMNGVCSSVDALYEHYKSQAIEFAGEVASRHFRRSKLFSRRETVQDTDYTEELLGDIEYAFNNPKDADIVFADIRKAKVVQNKDRNTSYAAGLEQLEKLQGMLNIPADQVDPRSQTFPAHVRELANKLVTWADMKFFIQALEEGNVKPFEDMTKELKNKHKDVPKACAGLVYNAEEGVTANSELFLLDIEGKPDLINIRHYVTASALDDEQGAKVMERRLKNAFEALLMVGQEIPDERMEKVEPEPQDGPLPPPPPYLGPLPPPPGPPPYKQRPALPGPPQDGEDESEFTEVDELEEGDDGKKGFTVPKMSKPADAQDKDIEYECPLCGANVKDEDPKCPECGAEFEKSKDEEGEK
jgi:hypothetical protein